MSQENKLSQNIENRAVWKLALYVFGVVVVSTMMLAVNAGMIFGLFHGVASYLPGFPGIDQLMQLIVFIAPFLLLYLEWYVWDVISARRLRSHTID